MLHYADQFKFDHGRLDAPFRPMAYADAIQQAVKAGYRVIVVDSMSHEHAGDGGLLDWHDEELDRMAGDDWRKREKCKFSAWIKPKSAHKKMVQALLGLPPSIHLILCLRAEEKIEIVKKDGRTEVVPKRSPVGLGGWIPICEKSLPYEMTISFLLTADKPGIPQPIKLQEQHRPMIPLDKPLDEQCGKRLAEWAAGGEKKAPAKPKKSTVTESQIADLETLIEDVGADRPLFLKHLGVDDLTDLDSAGYTKALKAIEAKRQKNERASA